jgi:hypothetical protein
MVPDWGSMAAIEPVEVQEAPAIIAAQQSRKKCLIAKKIEGVIKLISVAKLLHGMKGAASIHDLRPHVDGSNQKRKGSFYTSTCKSPYYTRGSTTLCKKIFYPARSTLLKDWV